jgi:hypothetical protein
MGWAWWCTPVIPALRGLRREDREFEVNLGYRGRPHLNSSRYAARGRTSEVSGHHGGLSGSRGVCDLQTRRAHAASVF